MKSVAIILALFGSLLATGTHAQPRQTDCERDADSKLNEMWGVSATVGAVTYKKIMDRAVACMQGGQCSKPEALVRLQEIMVDDQVIDFQRRKVAAMKRFVSQAGPSASPCLVASLLAPLIEELASLNAQQLARFELLALQSYPSRQK